MKYFKNILAILLAFVLHKTASFGETNILTVTLIFVAFGLYCYGTIYLAYNVTNFAIPIDQEKQESFRAFRDNKTMLEKLFDAATLKRLKLQSTISILLIIVFIFGFASIYFTWLDKWVVNEIKTNYVERTVVIKSISWAKGRYADFEFEFNNVKYKDRTKDSYLQIGDTIKISFSTNNPKILRVINAP